MATLLTPSNIIVGAVFASILIFALIKISTSLSGGVKKIKYIIILPFTLMWKVVSKPWRLVGWLLALGAGYGIYLIVISNLPTPEEKNFSELSKNLAEVELQPEKDKLSKLNAKVKGGETLTEEEKRTAMNATKKIGKVRKNYSKGKLVAPPPPKPTADVEPVEVWDWTFEWEATPDQVRRNENQEKGLINEARIIFRDEKVLKFNYKRPSGKLVELTLSRNGSVKEFYQGKVSQSDLYLRVWLIPDDKHPGNFIGTADNGPNSMQMEIFLKKKL